MRKALLVLFAVLSLTLGLVGTASANHLEPNEAAEYCRELDEAGILDARGITRGECVNLFMEYPSDNANNFIAAVCGYEFFQTYTGTTNKGQCIQILRGIL